MIYEVLAEGAQNARPGREICDLLGISRRELAAAIEKERREGKPICAATSRPNPGYFLAANKAELERYCQSLFHRAGELHKTRKACLAALEDLPA